MHIVAILDKVVRICYNLSKLRSHQISNKSGDFNMNISGSTTLVVEDAIIAEDVVFSHEDGKECWKCGNTAKVCGGCDGFPLEFDVLAAYRRMENREATPKTEGALMIQCCKDEDGSYIFKMRTLDEKGNWDWAFLDDIQQKIANTRLMRMLTGATPKEF